MSWSRIKKHNKLPKSQVVPPIPLAGKTLISCLTNFLNSLTVVRRLITSRYGTSWYPRAWRTETMTARSWNSICTSTSWSMWCIPITRIGRIRRLRSRRENWKENRRSSNSSWTLRALICRRPQNSWPTTPCRTFRTRCSTLLSSLCSRSSGWRTLRRRSRPSSTGTPKSLALDRPASPSWRLL